jgi:hypothetical protein
VLFSEQHHKVATTPHESFVLNIHISRLVLIRRSNQPPLLFGEFQRCEIYCLALALTKDRLRYSMQAKLNNKGMYFSGVLLCLLDKFEVRIAL